MRKIYEIYEDDKYYPKNLIKVKNHPQKLYVMGNRKLLNNDCVAIVGSRDNTVYGEFYASNFAKDLSSAGITIISGLAVGIDSIAHKNSMCEEGKTIAVLGCGFYHIYPKENTKLVDKILKNKGVVISEYPPETTANLSKFPMRNRIIAGIADCTIVIEAKFRSGSGITARQTLFQKKPVFCVPGRLGDKTGKGTNNLIKSGANILTDINDVLKLFNKDKIESPEMSNLRIKNKYRAIYNLIKKTQMSQDEISRTLNMEIYEVNTLLMEMELEGLVEVCSGNIVKIKEWEK